MANLNGTSLVPIDRLIDTPAVPIVDRLVSKSVDQLEHPLSHLIDIPVYICGVGIVVRLVEEQAI